MSNEDLNTGLAMISIFSHIARGEESISEGKFKRALKHISNFPDLPQMKSAEKIQFHFENPASFIHSCEQLKDMKLAEKLRIVIHSLPLAVEDDIFDDVDMIFLERLVSGLFKGNQKDLILRHIQLSFELEQVKDLLGIGRFFET